MSQEHIGTRNFVQIGLFGGLFWGGIWYFLHIFSFTEAGPNYLLLPFAFGSWKEGVWGNVSGIVCMGLLSILIAFCIKRFWQSLKEFFQGLFMVYFGGRYYFSEWD